MRWKIYKIENRITLKCYIGITGQPIQNRWKVHCSEANLGTRHRAIHSALAKYGIENFEFSIIGYATTDDLAKRSERLAIRIYNSLAPNGYNLTSGGDGSYDPSPETRKKMRDSHLGKVQSPETIKKRTLQMTGKKRSPESVEKSASARRGAKRSEEFKAACRERAKAQFESKLARENASLSIKAKWTDPDYRSMMMKRRSRSGPASVEI